MMQVRGIQLPKLRGAQLGFTLLEVLVGVSVFVVIVVSVYQGFAGVQWLVRLARLKITATELANEQIEIIRNLPYADVGISGGLPAGKVPPDQTLTRGGVTFRVEATIRTVDDPFDGTSGGTPNDPTPADYKLVDLTVSCVTCQQLQPVAVTTIVAPRNLESSRRNDTVFIAVLDPTKLAHAAG